MRFHHGSDGKVTQMSLTPVLFINAALLSRDVHGTQTASNSSRLIDRPLNICVCHMWHSL